MSYFFYWFVLAGARGLGFSVTTRDNPTGGKCKIYIKKILPVGPAIENGALQSDDQLLEVGWICLFVFISYFCSCNE